MEKLADSPPLAKLSKFSNHLRNKPPDLRTNPYMLAARVHSGRRPPFRIGQ